MSRTKRFAESRRRLIECDDYSLLSAAGHALIDGVVLTSVSDAPFEMSFKCTHCAAVFWFENLAWRVGGIAQWRLGAEAREVGISACALMKPASASSHMHLGAEWRS